MEFLATAEFWVAVSFVLFLGLVVYFGYGKQHSRLNVQA